MYEIPVIPAIAGFAVICVWAYNFLIYPIFLSPLAKIPNAHPTSCFSPAWILRKRQTFKQNKAIHAAHVAKGPVVRLGPSEISVNCVEGGIRTVYAGGFDKHVWYPNLFSNYDGVQNMFSTADGRPHSVRKRMMSNVYSKSVIHSSVTMAAASRTIMVERLLPYLEDHLRDGKGIDAMDIFNACLMDLVTAYQFGLRSSTNFIQNRKKAHWWLGHYQSRKKFTFWPQELPGLTNFMSYFGINLSPKWVSAANHDLEAHCLSLCDAAENYLASPDNDPANIPVVYGQLKAALEKSTSAGTPALGDPAPHRLQIASDMLDHLSAGHETSGITLTYLFHELSQRPDLQAELRTELATLSPQLPTPTSSATAPMPSARSIDNLPLLHAILMETLRLHAAIPGSQPRITPVAKGSGPGTTLGAYANLPGNIRVSAQAYSLHRNANVFPDPESWHPERWLPRETSTTDAAAAEAERRAEMARWFWAFGSGGRMCIGSNLAMMQMKLITATIVSNYRTHVISDDGIEQEDAYTARPLGKVPLVLGLERA